MNAFSATFKPILLKLIPNSILTVFYSRRVTKYNELSLGERDFFHAINDDVQTIFDVGARTDVFYSSTPPTTTSGSDNTKASLNRRVFMFEANPKFSEVLRTKVDQIGGVNTIVSVAIGAERGELNYFYDSQSFIEVSNVGNKSKYRSFRKIAVETIDTYASTIPDLDFIKIDIEEMDFMALVGARETLGRVRFIQFELGIGAEYKSKKVTNSDYWDLLDPIFDLYILKDEANPIWQAHPGLELLIPLDSEAKSLIEVLQRCGVGFNIVGLNRSFEVSQKLASNIRGATLSL